jgi:hypothetical protein
MDIHFKVLFMRRNRTYRSSTVVFYYTLQHVSPVHICHHQVDVGYTKINMKGEGPVFTMLSVIKVLVQERNNEVKFKSGHPAVYIYIYIYIYIYYSGMDTFKVIASQA